MIDLLSYGELRPAVTTLLRGAKSIALAEVTLDAPIPRPGKVLAIGLNYRDHAEESGQQIPKYPLVFTKVSTCIIGPGAPIERPLPLRVHGDGGRVGGAVARDGRALAR
jgi:2-keto-4-pentenoate hydratase/2-oxohepta-3-ene-1,7-dioic acid hydratase in catechol pathway